MHRPLPPLWLLVLITFSGTVATHIFVPALPQAALSLHAAPGPIQLTISLYILGLALGQPIYGPLSDSYGRRPVLMVGLALFTLGGLLSLWAPDVRLLAAARFVQALGGCAGLVLGRAIVRDNSGMTQSVRRLAMINLITMIGPGLAPLLGQTVTDWLGWRFIFVLLIGLGLLNLLLTWRILPETSQPSGHFHPGQLKHDYGRLLSSRPYLALAIGGGCATTSIYAFLASAPFIFVQEMHRPPHEVALYLGLLVAGLSVGNALASRLIGRVSVEHLMLRANALSLASAALLLVVLLAGQLHWWLVLALLLVFNVGAGMTSPAALTRTLSVHPDLVGSAAGLYGAIQMVVGALCTAAVGLGHDPALAMATVLVGASTLSQLGFRDALRKPAH